MAGPSGCLRCADPLIKNARYNANDVPTHTSEEQVCMRVLLRQYLECLCQYAKKNICDHVFSSLSPMSVSVNSILDKN